MATSQNGYEANNRALLAPFMVGDRKFMFRRGAPGWLLWHCISWFDANIRDINPGIPDDWSYAERPIRGSEETSNHASGTAGDVDATRWPLGREPEAYLTGDEIRRLREQLRVYEGCIRWGGDYTGRKDPMHFEINRDEATCDRVMAKLQASGDARTQEDDDMARFITATENSPWFITDGFTKRLIPPGPYAEALLKAGVVGLQKDGTKVAVVGKAVVDSIPLAR